MNKQLIGEGLKGIALSLVLFFAYVNFLAHFTTDFKVVKKVDQSNEMHRVLKAVSTQLLSDQQKQGLQGEKLKELEHSLDSINALLIQAFPALVLVFISFVASVT